MKKNVASQAIGAQMVSATDGSAFTGAVTVYVCGDAGTQAAGSVGSGACTHEGNGYHTYAPAQAETNYDLIAFTFIATGAVPATVQVFTDYPQTGDAYASLAGGVTVADKTGYALTAAYDAAKTAASQTSVNDVPTVAEFEARTLVAASYFDPATDTVLVGANSDKTGYALASDGLDAISVTAPAGVASNFREMVVQVWRRFYRKATMTQTELQTFADDNTTVLTTQAVSDDGSTQTQGAAS